jgi:hypothetical protein
MYYTAETMTTVGYGDITPASDSERVVLFFLMILGGTFYGYLIGSMSAVVADSDAASNECVPASPLLFVRLRCMLSRNGFMMVEGVGGAAGFLPARPARRRSSLAISA